MMNNLTLNPNGIKRGQIGQKIRWDAQCFLAQVSFLAESFVLEYGF
jgi:hypothetical protein